VTTVNLRFGMVSGSVVRRHSELAIRLALGASHQRMLRLVLGEGALLVVVGILIAEMRWVVAPHLYRPLEQDPLASMSVLLRLGSTGGDPGAVERVAMSLDRGVPFSWFEPIQAKIAGVLVYPRFRALFLGFFALSALLLSAVGLHGVLSQLLTKRTSEFGVRRAI